MSLYVEVPMETRLLTIVTICLVLAAVRADDQPDAKVMLDKAMKAMGGEAKLAKLKTAAAKVKLSTSEGGMDFTIDMDATYQGLSQYRAELEVQGGGQNFKGMLVINGDKGWFKRMDKTEDAPEGM